ncbi:hypothetical protein GOV12_04970 [Candidatus Pacearchaeota archaeon]|nr:hypothetical protein [Candidatus Pacearchaeota archaeon]
MKRGSNNFNLLLIGIVVVIAIILIVAFIISFNKSTDKIRPRMDEGLGSAGIFVNEALEIDRCEFLSDVVKNKAKELIEAGENVILNAGDPIKKNDYFVVANEYVYYLNGSEAYRDNLLQLVEIINDSDSYNLDILSFIDVMNGSTIEATITSEGIGEISVLSKRYIINYFTSDSNPDNWYITIKHTYSDYEIRNETVPLFTGTRGIYLNDQFNKVKGVITNSELPNLLTKGMIGDATFTQTIDIGNYPRLIYGKGPTIMDDPTYGIDLSTNIDDYIYNASVSFSRAVDFNSPEIIGEKFNIFGKEYIVGSSLFPNSIVLYESSYVLNFDSTGIISEKVIIDGSSYTVEMVSASTTTATIKVTEDNTGTSEQNQITVGNSRLVNSVTITVTSVDMNNLKYIATVSASSDNKLTLSHGGAVMVGESQNAVEGTLVNIVGGSSATTRIIISVAASDTQNDFIKAGDRFSDPVFGTINLEFTRVNNPENSIERDEFEISSAGDDKLQILFSDKDGDETMITYVKTHINGDVELQIDDDGRNITVMELSPVFKNELVVVGNEEVGYLLKVGITNSTSGTDYSADRILFTNVFDSGETFESVESSEGIGTVTIGGRVYSLQYFANDITNQDKWNVTINYPDSAFNSGEIIVYPTIQTKNGAKVSFYEPLTFDITNHPRIDGYQQINIIKIPNGNGYSDLDVSLLGSIDGNFIEFRAGEIDYTLVRVNGDICTLYMNSPRGGFVDKPAIVMFEEKGPDEKYNAMIVTTKSGRTSTDATAVESVVRTWSNDLEWEGILFPSNSDIVKKADIYGTIAVLDSTDANHKKATISYPDNMIEADIFVSYYKQIESIETYNNCFINCTEDWTCSVWSECSNGLRSRTCTDNSGCGIEINKPKETEICNENCEYFGYSVKNKVRDLIDLGENVILKAGDFIKLNDYIVVTAESGNYANGSVEYNDNILQLTKIVNDPLSFTEDKISFVNGLDDTTRYYAVITSEGSGNVLIESERYLLKYYASDPDSQNWYVTLKKEYSSYESLKETVPLFIDSNKINLNDVINNVKSVITNVDLPVLLNDGDFNGISYLQYINLGGDVIMVGENYNPRFIYAKGPTSSDDPSYGIYFSTSTSRYLYNSTILFNEPVDFTLPDSIGKKIELFGKNYSIGLSNSPGELILFEDSSLLNFDSSGLTFESITIDGVIYTIELVSASTASATIKVTNDETGTNEQKQITTGNSKRINSIIISVISADSNNLKYTAVMSAGNNRITLLDGGAVVIGDSRTNIDGTLVTIVGGTSATTKIVISVAAVSSEHDFIKSGERFSDPFFGTINVDFSGGVNIPENSFERENITISRYGNDKMQIRFTDYRDYEAQIIYTKSRGPLNIELQRDDDGKNITVMELAPVYNGEYVVLGNEDEGYLLRVGISNSTHATDYSADRILFYNAEDTFESTESAEGIATVTIGGKVYNIQYFANDPSDLDKWNITLEYPDSQPSEIIVYPTIQTKYGAKIGFYEPLEFNIEKHPVIGYDNSGFSNYSLINTIKIPNGNGYSDMDVSLLGPNDGDFIDFRAGEINYRLYRINGDECTLYMRADGNRDVEMNVLKPAIIMFEERGPNDKYEAIIITSKYIGGIDEVIRTWGNDSEWNYLTLNSESNLSKDADIYGTVVYVDNFLGKATIMYPDEPVIANLFMSYYEQNEVIEDYNSCFNDCSEDWTCSAWSACSGGTKSRTCTDNNDCGTLDNRPALSEGCGGSPGGGDNTGTGGSSTITYPSVDTTPTKPKTEEQVDIPGPIKYYIGDEEVEVKKSGEYNVLQISGNDILTKYEIKKQDNKIFIETENLGEVEMKYPFDKNLVVSKHMDYILEIEIIEKKDKLTYNVQGTKKGFLFFMIPINGKIQVSIDVSNGLIISKKKPWWAFLAFKI